MPSVDVSKLDWNLLWKQEKKKKSWKSKGAEEWDKKAASFAKRTASSTYIDEFLKRLAPQSNWSVLDAGCGPGTLSIPLSFVVRRVSCLDFSNKMLSILQQRAEKQGRHNITICNGAWEDDWNTLQIPTHDVALASRSLAVQDLKKALFKLSTHARKKVVITDRVKHGPFDPDAFAAIGRPLRTGPDYIFTLNLLYQMGYLPTVDYIRIEDASVYPSFTEALASYTWMFQDLNKNEEKRLKNYLHSITTITDDDQVAVHRPHVPTWAYISWQP